MALDVHEDVLDFSRLHADVDDSAILDSRLLLLADSCCANELWNSDFGQQKSVVTGRGLGNSWQVQAGFQVLELGSKL